LLISILIVLLQATYNYLNIHLFKHPIVFGHDKHIWLIQEIGVSPDSYKQEKWQWQEVITKNRRITAVLI